MDGFALDPALFGVAGPSSSITGRVRDVPKQAPLLSDSGTDEGSESNDGVSEEDEEAEDEDDDDEPDDDEEEDEGEEGQERDDEDGDEAGNAEDASQRQTTSTTAHGTRFTAQEKGKGRSTQNRLPPLPAPRQAAHTDAETDYATDAGEPGGLPGAARSASNEELGRLISAIRDTPLASDPAGAGNRGLLGQQWDRTMQQELEELDREEEESRAATGQRKKPRKPRGRTAVADMEPTPEVKNMLGKANMAYVSGQTKEAIDALTEIIRIEPSTKAAWYTLSSIHEELGNHEKALQMKLVPAHLSKSDPETWKDLGSQSSRLGLMEQAIYCYGQALRVDPADVEALWDRASLFKTTGKIRQAITSLTKLLKLQPHNPNVLREIGPLYYEILEIDSAISVFVAAYNHFRTKVPVPKDPSEIDGFSTNELELLSDFLRSHRRYREAAKVIMDGQRWLQGRIQEESTWIKFGDDREYDLQRKVRVGWEDHPQKWCEDAPIHQLETGLRLRLGLCRLYEGKAEEAGIHFDVIRQGDILDNPEYYGEIADAYFEKKMWTEAMEVYLDMSENEETNVPAVWVKIAQCQRNLGDFVGAAECYQAVVDSEPTDYDSKLALAEVYERLNDRGKALELVNEVLQQRRNAQAESDIESTSGSEYEDDNAQGDGLGADADEPDPNDVGIDGGLIKKKRKGRKSMRKKGLHAAVRRSTTAEQRREEERQTQEAFDTAHAKLKEIDRLMEECRVRDGDAVDEKLFQDWLETAGFLLDTFRTTKALFPSDGKKKFSGIFRRGRQRKEQVPDVDQQANDIAARLQASIADDERPVDEPDANVEQNAYRGVTFDDWAYLTVKYANMLTLVDERDEAREVLRHMQTSSMMRTDVPRWQLLIFGLVSCAMWAGDYAEAVDEYRRIVASRTAETEPLRLLHAICSSGLPALDAFVDTKLQKYLLRKVKDIDQKALSSLADDEPDDSPAEDEVAFMNEAGSFKPTKVNPHFLMVYGHLMAAGKSYQSAIVYYLRAYDMRPNDPLICLSLALAYTHRAMQRQTDNRQYQLAQAIALLDGYRKHRKSEEEVNYNIARIFHQLGVLDLAVKHYEKVLSFADQRNSHKGVDMEIDGGSERLDLSREAAYNLSLIYFTRNAPDLARDVVDKYLSL